MAILTDLKKGTKVKYTPPAIEGRIVAKKYDEENESFLFIVEYVDALGETHQKYFEADQLEIVE